MQTVSFERDGRIAIVTIERPERRNAVDGATARQLYDAFKAFDADEDLDVAVLPGRGGYFCAGAASSTLLSRRACRFVPDFGCSFQASSQASSQQPTMITTTHSPISSSVLPSMS